MGGFDYLNDSYSDDYDLYCFDDCWGGCDGSFVDDEDEKINALSMRFQLIVQHAMFV